MSFYQSIARDYDRITGAGERARAARAFLRGVLEAHPARTALDAACGAGLYALTLAELGAPFVVGLDREQAMLEQAARTARARGTAVQWILADMAEAAAVLRRRFDLILCLGNSLPHLRSPETLRQTLCGFRELAAPGGAIWLQTLNFDRILERRERIIGIERAAGREFLRFYDFLEDGRLRFNLLRIHWPGRASRPRYDLQSTVLQPYRSRELLGALAACGLRAAGVFGSFQLEPFDAEESPTCLVRAIPAG